MASAARATYERWTSVPIDDDEPDIVGVQTEPASAEALDEFEAQHHVKLPSAFRELYSLSDGTSQMDGCENIFWPIAAISSQISSFDIEDPSARWIGFADFRLQTAVFYLRLDRVDGADSVWIDTYESKEKLPDRMRRVTASFEEFLERYAAEPIFWKG